jgi:Zn-dependent peptidase ImmA (M78 family)/DNA-binding XRE family transcriptional regulator
MVASFEELGKRIAEARKAAGMTQQELGGRTDLDRTSVSKIESGFRAVDALELARIAEAVRRPLLWFLAEPSPAVISRREARETDSQEADILLEMLAADVEFLVERHLLAPPTERPNLRPVTDVASAEKAATDLRMFLEISERPIDENLVDTLEKVALYTFVLPFKQEHFEGSYLSLKTGGVALIQGGRDDIGRRRFTIAHELGHHILEDAYSTEWIPTHDGEERERLINAFAVHFLLPRGSVTSRWEALEGREDPWNAAVFLAAEFGVSWTALCAHLRNIELIHSTTRHELEQRVPRGGDFIERGLRISPEPRAPTVPRSYAAAVIKGLRRHKLGRGRALEMLRGTAIGPDLDGVPDVPLAGMMSELGPLT